MSLAHVLPYVGFLGLLRVVTASAFVRVCACRSSRIVRREQLQPRNTNSARPMLFAFMSFLGLRAGADGQCPVAVRVPQLAHRGRQGKRCNLKYTEMIATPCKFLMSFLASLSVTAVPCPRVRVPVQLAHRETGTVAILRSALYGVCAGCRSSRIGGRTQSGAIPGAWILEPGRAHWTPLRRPGRAVAPRRPWGRCATARPSRRRRGRGTRLADTFGAVCPQRPPDVANRTAALQRMPRGRYLQLRRLVPHLRQQSEDCLFLNLYVPGSGNRGLEAPYAVLVFVHGESFEWNSGNPYDGSVLASFGHVIVATFNFRLGILGFLRTRAGGLSAGEPELALEDAAACLRWVRTNIAAFGGDPGRVTLLGHDTGAALVNLLLLSGAAAGLFQRAALLSGSALSPWAQQRRPDALRASVAAQLGCA
ncbi:Venom carboxylesterase-6, partial [Gryllus bimaculatus]